MTEITFEPVDITDIPESNRGRNGAGTNEVVDSFLQSPHTTVKVQTGLDGLEGEELKAAQKRTASIRSSASTYIERLELPVKLFTRDGAIYLHKDESMPEVHRENKARREANRLKREAEKAAQTSEVSPLDPDATTDGNTEYVDAAEQVAYADA